METKDWILLLVPILANGTIFAVVGRILDRKYNNIQKKDTRSQIIIDEFLNETAKAKRYYIEFKLTVTNEDNSRNIQELVTGFMNHLQEMYIECETNPVVLEDYREYVDNLFKCYQGLRALILNSSKGSQEQNNAIYHSLDEEITRCFSLIEKMTCS